MVHDAHFVSFFDIGDLRPDFNNNSGSIVTGNIGPRLDEELGIRWVDDSVVDGVQSAGHDLHKHFFRAGMMNSSLADYVGRTLLVQQERFLGRGD